MHRFVGACEPEPADTDLAFPEPCLPSLSLLPGPLDSLIRSYKSCFPSTLLLISPFIPYIWSHSHISSDLHSQRSLLSPTPHAVTYFHVLYRFRNGHNKIPAGW